MKQYKSENFKLFSWYYYLLKKINKYTRYKKTQGIKKKNGKNVKHKTVNERQH